MLGDTRPRGVECCVTDSVASSAHSVKALRADVEDASELIQEAVAVLETESMVLERLMYKSTNQHRRGVYFRKMMHVWRLLRRKSTNKMLRNVAVVLSNWQKQQSETLGLLRKCIASEGELLNKSILAIEKASRFDQVLSSYVQKKILRTLRELCRQLPPDAEWEKSQLWISENSSVSLDTTDSYLQSVQTALISHCPVTNLNSIPSNPPVPETTVMPLARSIPQAVQSLSPSPSTQGPIITESVLPTIVMKPSTALPITSLPSVASVATSASPHPSADSLSESNDISIIPVSSSRREASIQPSILSTKRSAVAVLMTNRGEKKSRREPKTDRKTKKTLKTSKLKRKTKKKKRSLDDADMDDIFAVLGDD